LIDSFLALKHGMLKVDHTTDSLKSKLNRQDDQAVKIFDGNKIDENRKRVEMKVDQIIDSVKLQKANDMHLHDYVLRSTGITR